MGLMKYLDTSIEDVDRIKEARNNINKGTILTLLFSFIILLLGVAFMFYDEYSLGISFLVIAVFYFIMAIGLILKREIFSMMIFLRTVQEEK